MAEIKLNKRYKYAGDIVKALSNRLQWTLEDVTEFMNSIEYADVEEVKHGYWINHYSDLYPADCTQECSICHAEEGGNLWNDNYCPNCGARMDGRSET